MEKKQLKVSESEYAKNLGVAASAGAAIGGAAFAASSLFKQEHGKLTLMKTTRHWKLQRKAALMR